MVTCKDFLQELNTYLDEEGQPELRQELERHLEECPNCWVICDTTKKTISIYKGLDPYPIPRTVHDRLIGALRERATQRS